MKTAAILFGLFGMTLIGCGESKTLANEAPKGEYAQDIEKAKKLEPARLERDQGFENGG